MPTPLSAATGGLRSCGPHQASVWACLPTAWQSLGRPKKTPGGQPDRRRRWRMPSPPYVCTTPVSGAAWLSSSERSAHHMSSLIGSVGPNSIVSFPAATGQRQTTSSVRGRSWRGPTCGTHHEPGLPDRYLRRIRLPKLLRCLPPRRQVLWHHRKSVLPRLDSSGRAAG